MENEQLPAPAPASSAGGTAPTPASTAATRPPGPQISVYSGIPDRQTVQVWGWGALQGWGVPGGSWHSPGPRFPPKGDPAGAAPAAQHGSAVPAADVRGTAAAPHAADSRAPAAAPHQRPAPEPGRRPAGMGTPRAPGVARAWRTPHLQLFPKASLAANRQSGSSGGNGTQPAPAQQPTVSPSASRHPPCLCPPVPAPRPSPDAPFQINLATSPAAAQLLNRAQSVGPGASGIAQQAVLLGNTASPALTASQAQMYLRAQMVRVGLKHGTPQDPGGMPIMLLGVPRTHGRPIIPLWGGLDLWGAHGPGVECIGSSRVPDP